MFKEKIFHDFYALFSDSLFFFRRQPKMSEIIAKSKCSK